MKVKSFYLYCILVAFLFAPANAQLDNIMNKSTSTLAGITDDDTDSNAAYWETHAYQYIQDLVDAMMNRTYNDLDYASLSAAVTAAATDSATLIVSGTHTFTSNLTISGNTSILMSNSGYIDTDGYTLSIEVPFFHGREPCFNDTSGISFAYGTVGAIYPQWWQAPDDSSSDACKGIEYAIAAAQKHMIIKFDGYFKVDSTVEVGKNVILDFSSGTLYPGDTDVTPLQITTLADNVEIRSSWSTFVVDCSNKGAHSVDGIETNARLFTNGWCGVKAAGRYGVYFNEEVDATDNLNFSVGQFHIQSAGQQGFRLQNNGGGAEDVNACRFEIIATSCDTGVAVYDGQGNTFLVTGDSNTGMTFYGDAGWTTAANAAISIYDDTNNGATSELNGGAGWIMGAMNAGSGIPANTTDRWTIIENGRISGRNFGRGNLLNIQNHSANTSARTIRQNFIGAGTDTLMTLEVQGDNQVVISFSEGWDFNTGVRVDSLAMGSNGVWTRQTFWSTTGDSLGTISYNTVKSRVDTTWQVDKGAP